MKSIFFLSLIFFSQLLDGQKLEFRKGEKSIYVYQYSHVKFKLKDGRYLEGYVNQLYEKELILINKKDQYDKVSIDQIQIIKQQRYLFYWGANGRIGKYYRKTDLTDYKFNLIK